MKKYILIFTVLLLIAAVAISTRVISRNTNQYLNQNLEALSDAEMPSIPCVQAVSTCYFLVKNADGTVYNATVTGQRNVY